MGSARAAGSAGLGAGGDAARAVVLVAVPAVHRGDVDDGSRVRRVDDAIAAKVDTDVARIREEDEIARLEVLPQNRPAAPYVGEARSARD